MANIKFNRGPEAAIPTDGHAQDGNLYLSTDNGNMYFGSSQGTVIPVNRNPYYAVCSTSADDTVKDAVLTDTSNFTLSPGMQLTVCFSDGNTALSPLLKVNGSLTAFPIEIVTSDQFTTADFSLEIGETVTLVFDGNRWIYNRHTDAKVSEHTLFISTGKRPRYLRFTALEDNSGVQLNKIGSPYSASLEYAVNGGQFSAYTFNTNIPLSEGDYVEMRRTKGLAATDRFSLRTADSYYFSMTGKIAANGNIMSLLDSTCKSTTVNTSIACTFLGLFDGCSSLVSAPIEIPLTTVPSYVFTSMFRGCTNLEVAPYIKVASFGANAAWTNLFYNCSKMKSYHFATMDNSDYVFYGNTSCTSLTIDATTPPTIASNTITGLKSSCKIYVPAESVDAYKAASYWSARASYIQAIPTPEE